MNIVTFFMNLGTWVLAISSLPQMISIWKNRKNLMGYSMFACLALAIGLIFIGVAFIYMGDYLSMIAGAIQIFMWGMASYFLWRYKK